MAAWLEAWIGLFAVEVLCQINEQVYLLNDSHNQSILLGNPKAGFYVFFLFHIYELERVVNRPVYSGFSIRLVAGIPLRVITDGSLTRRPKNPPRCLLVEVEEPWQLNKQVSSERFNKLSYSLKAK